ncbi:hypothetical protein Trydic_g3345 [Trypoxylus dichotomus]
MPVISYGFVTLGTFGTRSCKIHGLSTFTIGKRSYADLGRIPYNLLYVSEHEKPKFFDMILYNFHKARLLVEKQLIHHVEPGFVPDLEKSKLEQQVKEVMTTLDLHDAILDVCFPFRRDDGAHELIYGYKAHYKSNRTPLRGAIRFSMDVTRDKIMALSTLSSFTNAFAKIPFGGSSGGLRIQPNDYNDNELRRITHKFVVEMYRKGFMAPSIDICAPEKGTRQREMSWIADFYNRTYGYGDIYASTCVTGKTLATGGLEGFKSGAADGLFMCLDKFINNKHFMEKISVTPGWKNKTYVMQGCGYIGTKIIKHLCRAGAKLIGIQTTRGSIINKNGIDGTDIVLYRKRTGTIVGYKDADPYPVAKNILEEPCDILILAATEQVITNVIAPSLNAKIILEASNGPITPAADRHLLGKNVLIIPDILANCGGPAVSYMEWQNTMQPIVNMRLRFKRNSDILFLKSVEEALNRQDYNLKITPLSDVLREVQGIRQKELTYAGLQFLTERSFAKVMKLVEQFDLGIDIRTAAYVGAIKRVFKDVYNYIY